MFNGEFTDWVIGATSVLSLAIGLRIVWTNYKLTNVVRNAYHLLKALGDDQDWKSISQAWQIEHDAKVAGAEVGRGYHVPRRWKAEVTRIVKAAIATHEKVNHGG